MNPFIFEVFFDKMSEAQSEIKSTVTVNTTDIAARANDDKDSVAAKDIERVVKKRACELLTRRKHCTEYCQGRAQIT